MFDPRAQWTDPAVTACAAPPLLLPSLLPPPLAWAGERRHKSPRRGQLPFLKSTQVPLPPPLRPLPRRLLGACAGIADGKPTLPVPSSSAESLKPASQPRSPRRTPPSVRRAFSTWAGRPNNRGGGRRRKRRFGPDGASHTVVPSLAYSRGLLFLGFVGVGGCGGAMGGSPPSSIRISCSSSAALASASLQANQVSSIPSSSVADMFLLLLRLDILFCLRGACGHTLSA